MNDLYNTQACFHQSDSNFNHSNTAQNKLVEATM